MKTFILKTKDGETIHKLQADNIEIACESFANGKKIAVGVLLDIYNVVVEEIIKKKK